MGLFDLFRGSKPQTPSAIETEPPLLRKNTVHNFPNAKGRFGWDSTNPIPSSHMLSSEGAEQYLTWLSWKGSKVTAERTGSIGIAGMPGMVDRYSISVNQINVGVLHICPYAKTNSFRLPKGFAPSAEYLKDSGLAVALSSSGKIDATYLKRLALNAIEVVGKDRANELDVDWNLFPLLLAYFDSTKVFHGDVKGFCELIYPKQFRPDELERFESLAAIPKNDIRHSAVP